MRWCHRPGGPAKFWKVYQLRLSNFNNSCESCKFWKLSNFKRSCGSCKVPALSNFNSSCDLARSQILPCVAAAFGVANCRTQFVQSEPTKIVSWILVLKKIFPNTYNLNYLKSWACFYSQELNLARSVLFPNFGTAAILIFSQISYIIYIESQGRKWKKNELFTL